MDAWITDAVLYRFDTPEVARALSSADTGKLDELIFNHRAAKLKLDAMVRDYASGFLSRDEFAVAKTVAEQAVQDARVELSKYQDRQAQALLPANQTIREAWDRAGTDWRHSVIKLLVEKIVVHEGHPGSHVWKGYRFDPEAIEVVWRV